MTFRTHDHDIDLTGLYTGTAFLLCPGPSLATMDLAPLRQPGLATMTLNRAAYLFRGTFHIAADNVLHTPDSVWRDPGMMKFIPAGRPPKDWPRYPNVILYRVHKQADYEALLHGDKIPMGFPGRGGRATLPIALGVLYRLGFRTVCLLGCDFHMSPHAPYCVPKTRTAEQAAGSGRLFDVMNKWFRELGPHFQRAGFAVVNATPGGRLEAFPRGDLAACVARARAGFPDPATEFPE